MGWWWSEAAFCSNLIDSSIVLLHDNLYRRFVWVTYSVCTRNWLVLNCSCLGPKKRPITTWASPQKTTPYHFVLSPISPGCFRTTYILHGLPTYGGTNWALHWVNETFFKQTIEEFLPTANCSKLITFFKSFENSIKLSRVWIEAFWFRSPLVSIQYNWMILKFLVVYNSFSFFTFFITHYIDHP